MYRTYQERIEALNKRRTRRKLRLARKRNDYLERQVYDQRKWVEHMKNVNQALRGDLEKIKDRIATMNELSVLLDPETKYGSHADRIEKPHRMPVPPVALESTLNFHREAAMIIKNLDMMDAAMKEENDHPMGHAMHFFLRTPSGNLAYKITEEAWQFAKLDPERIVQYIAELFANELRRPEKH